MPAASTFSGNYLSAQLGTLRLTQVADRVSGSFARSIDECILAGTMRGAVHDNVAEIAWEQFETCGGRRRRSQGRGFFLYDRLSEGRPAQLFGRRFLTAGSLVPTDDEPYNWLNFELRDDPWTAVESGAP
jgi:hypothetical protein